MAKLTTDQLIDGFKDLSLIELSEFIKRFEEAGATVTLK
jgi:large subunit ribosomal protein L7/L12